MANPIKGEVSFESEGRQFKLVYNYNALCELEDLLGVGVNQINDLLADTKKMKLSTVRAVFWAGLREHHPEIDIRRAGEMITQLKVPAIELVAKGLQLASPDPEAKGKGPQEPGAAAGPTPGNGSPS